MNPVSRQFFQSAALALLLLVLGCTSHPRRVECDGRLSPINPPASALQPASASQPAGTTHAKAALP
jgi:hypothetical protein